MDIICQILNNFFDFNLKIVKLDKFLLRA
jgi:hypothetical protein